MIVDDRGRCVRAEEKQDSPSEESTSFRASGNQTGELEMKANDCKTEAGKAGLEW